MIRIFIDMYFASLHIARTVDHKRIGADAAYREAVVAALCGTPPVATQHARAPRTAASLPRTA